MRISLVGPTHPYKGGIAQHTTEFALRLAAAGHDVEICSWSAQYPRLLYPGRQRVKRAEVGIAPGTHYPLSWRRPDGWWRLGRRLRGRADAVVVVVATPIQAPAYITVLRGLGAGRAGSPATLALCHNVIPHEPRRADQALMRALLRRAGTALVHSDAEAAATRALAGIPVRVARLPPHFLPPAGVADRPDRRPPAGSATLLFFGLVRPYKGLDVLLRALAAAPPGMRLIVAGEFWSPLGDVERLVQRLGIADRVDLRPGYVAASDMPALFGATDAVVLPYRSATASQQVLLANAYGLPVVATRVGTFPAQIRDGVDGLLAEPGDPASLAAALTALAAPGRLESLRNHVRVPDPDCDWSAYIAAAERALTARPTIVAPSNGRASAVPVRARPGGRARGPETGRRHPEP